MPDQNPSSINKSLIIGIGVAIIIIGILVYVGVYYSQVVPPVEPPVEPPVDCSLYNIQIGQENGKKYICPKGYKIPEKDLLWATKNKCLMIENKTDCFIGKNGPTCDALEYVLPDGKPWPNNILRNPMEEKGNSYVGYKYADSPNVVWITDAMELGDLKC